MKKLSILFLTNRIPWPLNDGGNIATYYNALFLSKKGHRVSFCSLNTKKHRQNPDVLTDFAKVNAVDINTDVTITGAFKGLFAREPYNVSRFRSEQYAKMLSRILGNEKFDIIQLEGSYMSIYMDVIRQHTKTPVILRSHNIEHLIWNRLADNEPNGVKKLYLKGLGRKIRRFENEHLPDYDGIVAITAEDEKYYHDHHFSGPLTTINAGVDIEKNAEKADSSFNKKFCFIGSMEWMPNVQAVNWYLENVWPEVIYKYPDAEFHVAGKNPPEDLSFPAVQGFTFHGMVEDAAEFVKEHHFFVVPLLAGGGMRIKIIEAMALGKCVISTGIGAEGLDITPGKNIEIADNVEQWMDVIDRLMEPGNESEEIGKEGFKLVKEKYSWEKITEVFEEFYSNFVQ